MKDTIVDGFVAIVKFVAIVFLLNIVLFNLGRFVLLIATFGRYPRGKTSTRHANWIMFTGFIVVVAIWTGIALYNNFGADNAAYLNHVAR